MPQAKPSSPVPLSTARGTFRVTVDGDADAPALILSNSLGTTLEMWDAQAARFAQDFRVVRYDTRGHGASVVTPGPYTFELLGGDVVALLDALRID